MNGLRAKALASLVAVSSLILLGAGNVQQASPARSAPPIPEARPQAQPAAAALAAIPKVVFDTAPRVRLHDEEPWGPMSATTFIDHSHLHWAHDGGCGDGDGEGDGDWGDGRPNATALGNGTIDHREKNAAPYCNHGGTWWRTNQGVRPRETGGPSGAEGFYLNIDNSYRDGQGFGGGEPVYYQFVPGNRIVFWFHWGFSQTLNVGRHEGDWEHIAIRLNGSNVPQEVEYFQHHGSCTLSWASAPRVSSHVRVWATKEAHGSYPAGADAHSGDRINGDGDLWVTENNLDRAIDMNWYGYGGGWGEVGNFSDSTGPDSPPFAKNPAFTSSRCDMDN